MARRNGNTVEKTLRQIGALPFEDFRARLAALE
jgi:hypothetical protein